MSKTLEELDASKAGVTQAELESAFSFLSALEEEKKEVDTELEAARANKLEAKEALVAANMAIKDILSRRDPIAEEWARADWIVRNADPDQPTPPMGNRPPGIKSKRV